MTLTKSKTMLISKQLPFGLRGGVFLSPWLSLSVLTLLITRIRHAETLTFQLPLIILHLYYGVLIKPAM